VFQPAEEARDREALVAVQLERLRETVGRIAQTNEVYHRHLEGIHPRDLESLEDLQRLPFLTKDQLRDAYPYRMACPGREAVLRVQMSSGTTGTPILNPYTAGDIRQWREVMARSLVAAGVTADDVILVTASFGLFTGGFGFHYGAEALGALMIPVGAGRTLVQLQLLRDLRVTVLAAIATYPLRMIEVARQEGFDFRTTKLRVAVLGSESWSEAMRARIEREMGLSAQDLIGMTETGGPGMGIECLVRDGIHVWDDHYLPEIIDRRTGRVLPDGEQGELVVTTLTRQGLPLIRYRTRDVTRVRSRERCACGRTGVRLDRFHGRTDDMIIFKGVNFYPSQVEQILLRQPGVEPEYQIVLERDAERGDHLVLCVEAGLAFDRAAQSRLLRELTDRLSLTAEIRPMPVGEIPRPAGKAVRVVDRRERTGAP
jgi:phenylacetate-CoA ligase